MTVFSFEFSGFVKKKKNWFTLIFAIVIAIIIAILPHVIALVSGGEDKEPDIYYVYFELANESVENFKNASLENVVIVENQAELDLLVSEKKIKEFYIVSEESITLYTTENYNMYDSHDQFSEEFSSFYMMDFMENNGMLEEYLERVAYLNTVERQEISIMEGGYTISDEGDKSEEEQYLTNFILGYVLVMITYISMMQFSGFAATSVANEKTSRAMESLISSTDTNSLIIGKVLGIFAASVIQVVLMCLVLFLGIFAAINFGSESMTELAGFNEILNGLFDSLTLEFFLFFLITYSLGFLLNLFIFASLAATISKMEELSSAISTGTIVSMISFFLGIFTFTMPQNAVIDTLAYVPLFSPLAIFAKYCMGYASTFDMIYAIIAPAIVVVLVAMFAAKLYRVGVLLYGTKPSNKQLLKAIFSKN